ncbi:hypothetical protein M3610_26850 [Neobacillus sp. MER 74]|uniref:hypothetical protein n=1 Tax=Neobacillus sp. MER 74 TaxID=2939566 RepID=UPI00203DF24F|nr:hypothetical protein [Neobacillus sp. MER 74]MCM3118802.1 hypothetical protein [Neobacillus sp. MER 74]
MDSQKTEFDIGGKLLIGVGMVSATFLGAKFIDYQNRKNAMMAGTPIKDNSYFDFDIDLPNKKLKINRKTEFEMKEPKTIIKEVPVVPGFKKTKKVRVQVDQDGNEIPGTEENVM